MPHRPRFALPNVPLHRIQRGGNQQACFGADEDYGAKGARLDLICISTSPQRPNAKVGAGGKAVICLIR
jgi:hypothetical protein